MGFCDKVINTLKTDRRVEIPLAILFGAGIAVIIFALNNGFANCDRPGPPTTTTPTPTGNSSDSTTTTTTPSPVPASPYFNVFTLRSLQTFCNTSNSCLSDIPIPDANLSIVGLLTSVIEKQTFLKDCRSNETFDLAQFNQSTIEKLNQRWAAPYKNFTNRNKVFWEDEWNTFGTCTGYNVTDYFNKTLNLADKFLLDSWLNQSSIYPDNNRPYFVQNFADSLTKNNTLNENEFVLTCQTVANRQWLDRIDLCLSYSEEDSSVSVNCEFLESNCNESLPIYFVQNYTAPVGAGGSNSSYYYFD